MLKMDSTFSNGIRVEVQSLKRTGSEMRAMGLYGRVLRILGKNSPNINKSKLIF